jgi:hypothetical protein
MIQNKNGKLKSFVGVVPAHPPFLHNLFVKSCLKREQKTRILFGFSFEKFIWFSLKLHLFVLLVNRRLVAAPAANSRERNSICKRS